jgi:hypothetical protein
MKATSLFVAGLAVAIWSIAPANAEKNENNQNHPKCSTTTWPVHSATPCLGPNFHPASYVECTTTATKMGWRASDAWWGCSNQGFKN